MEKKLKEIVKILTNNKKTISTMESCTGGFLASKITDIEGASNVLKYSAITYSNEFKIKMGVDKEIIKKHSVYSIEVAKEMSKKITDFTNSDYGIGIIGKLNKKDESNNFGKDNEVFISIYEKETNKYFNYNIFITKQTRKENKTEVVELITSKLLEIIKKER